MSELLIIGGGFAGLKAAMTAAYENKENNGDVQITLISDRNFLVIRPRLYENSPEKMKVDLEPILEAIGVEFAEGTVSDIDTQNKAVTVKKTKLLEVELKYNQLILAAGSILKPLPIPGIAEHSWNIDTYETAIELDSHLLKIARLPNMPGHQRIVILGAGITGIELATNLRNRLAFHSNEETAAQAEIILVDQAEHVGPTPQGEAETVYREALQKAGVDVRLGQSLTKVTPLSVTLDNGEELETATVVVTAGLQANPLTELLKVERDSMGRVLVDESLRVKGIKNVFAAGDVAAAYTDAEHITVMSCQHAMPTGAHAGYNAVHSLLGLPHQKYTQPIYQTCIDLGPTSAVQTMGWERDIKLIGEDAKALKNKINQDYIYPPKGDAEKIHQQSHVDAHWADAD